MSGTDELRESIVLMRHGATTNLWNYRLIMLGILTFFFACVSRSCVSGRCGDVLWIVLWWCLMFTEKAEVQKSILSLAMEVFVWAINWTWRRPRAFTVALMVTEDEQRLNYVGNMA